MVGLGRQLASLRHCSGACGGVLPSLVQSINLIRAKKSITPIDLNIIFFASAREPLAKFLKLVLD